MHQRSGNQRSAERNDEAADERTPLVIEDVDQ